VIVAQSSRHGGLVTPPAAGGGPPADLIEDFSSYSSTANLMSGGSKPWWSTGEDVCGNSGGNGSCPTSDTGTIWLDTSVGLNAGGHSLSQSMRYDQPASPVCASPNDPSVGRNINLPSTQVEIWLEIWAMFSSGWSAADNRSQTGGGCDPGYKFIFGRINGTGDRWSLGVEGGTGTQDLNFIASYPPTGSTNLNVSYASAGFAPRDGGWHRYRMHWKCGSGNGVDAWWFDNNLCVNRTGISPAANNIYGLALGRNINSGPVLAQSIWWGLVQVWWTQDPGWGA